MCKSYQQCKRGNAMTDFEKGMMYGAALVVIGMLLAIAVGV
jgi:hypothetical protein